MYLLQRSDQIHLFCDVISITKKINHVTNVSKLRPLLDNRDVVSVTIKPVRCRQAGNAGADYHDLQSISGPSFPIILHSSVGFLLAKDNEVSQPEHRQDYLNEIGVNTYAWRRHQPCAIRDVLL